MYSMKRKENERRLVEIKAVLQKGGLTEAQQNALEDELIAVIRKDAHDELEQRRDDDEARRLLEEIELEQERIGEARIAKARGEHPVPFAANYGRKGPGRFPKNWSGHAAI